jgi:dihydrofolate reductase
MNRLIVAADRKLGLAKQGFQPWFIPDDEQYFTDQTKKYGGHVLYGSRTYELSLLRKPLEGRQNYLLTYDKAPVEGVEVVNDLDRFLKDFQGQDLWVIGGANVFAQVMQAGKADELYVTHIEADFGCNQFFPEYDKGFKLAEKSDLCEENGFIYYYATYVRA